VLTGTSARPLEGLGPLVARASATLDADAPSVGASGPVRLRDDDADGDLDAVATFATDELRAAGLLGADTTRLSVRLSAGDRTVVAGSDRLFDAGAWLLGLPEPSGHAAVGTTCLLLTDESRPDSVEEGRRIALRVWYPALATGAQPADYFLDAREARLNAENNGLPASVFDRVHGASRLDVEMADSGPYPVLLMSTGWSSPITLYSSIAQELASHGYVVLGIAHPDGSGTVVYPDGSDSGFDPESPSSDEVVESWALDVAFVARWLDTMDSSPGALSDIASRPDIASAVLSSVDVQRVGAVAHSLGGAAVVRAAVHTPTIRASANIDGSFRGPILEQGPATPVLVMLYDGHVAIDPSPIAFREQAARSPVYEATVLGSGHNDFTDYGALVLALAALDPRVVPAEQLVGSIGPARAWSIESAYLRAFFGAELGGAASPLMSAPAPEYPEVSFSAYPAND
jgi:dienelactone hydrolase